MSAAMLPPQRTARAMSRKDRRSRSPVLARGKNRKGQVEENQGEEDERSVVLLVGGTGRLGGIVAKHLVTTHGKHIKLLIGGRSKTKCDARAEELKCEAVTVDVSKIDPHGLSLKLAIEWHVDIVVNAVGPFHHQCTTLIEAAIGAGCHYLDVCDDIHGFARRAKYFHREAVHGGSICITTAGIFPGLSNLIAADMIEQGQGAELARLDYFMSGSGGFGTSSMMSSMTDSVTPAIVFHNTRQEQHLAFTGRRLVDFGPVVGRRAVYHCALPEPFSIQEVYQVPNVRAMVGIDPEFFNRILLFAGFLLRCLPQSWSEWFARYSMLTVKPFDWWLGRTFAMRIAVLANDKVLRIHRQTHIDGYEATGETVARQIMAVLNTENELAPGVWFPEEAIKGEARARIIEHAVGSSTHSDSTSATTCNDIAEDDADLKFDEEPLAVWFIQRVLLAIPLAVVFATLWDWPLHIGFPLLLCTLLWFA